MVKRSGLKSVFQGGLNEKTIKARSSGGGNPNQARLPKGEPHPLQFFTDINDEEGFKEFDQHIWQEGSWFFVPCGAKWTDCVVCDDEIEAKAKTSYAFAAQVYSFKDKKSMVLTQGTTLAQNIIFKYRRNERSFTKRVWEITALKTKPSSFDVSMAEGIKAINLKGKEPLDLTAYLKAEYQKYVDAHGGSIKSSSLEDDDIDEDDELEDDDDLEDEDDEEDEEDEDDDMPPIPSKKRMKAMPWAKLNQLARDRDCWIKTKSRTDLIDAIQESE